MTLLLANTAILMLRVWIIVSHNIDYDMSSAIPIYNFDVFGANRTIVRFYTSGIGNVLDPRTVVSQTGVWR